MGASFYRLRCEVFQNLFLSPMNTGFVRPAVATVPTACGIETYQPHQYIGILKLQQYLPLAVLKQYIQGEEDKDLLELQQYLPLAVLKR